ncbi:hypothetical protein JCM2811A_13540 [Methylorubrum rhodinum]
MSATGAGRLGVQVEGTVIEASSALVVESLVGVLGEAADALAGCRAARTGRRRLGPAALAVRLAAHPTVVGRVPIGADLALALGPGPHLDRRAVHPHERSAEFDPDPLAPFPGLPIDRQSPLPGRSGFSRRGC